MSLMLRNKAILVVLLVLSRSPLHSAQHATPKCPVSQGLIAWFDALTPCPDCTIAADEAILTRWSSLGTVPMNATAPSDPSTPKLVKVGDGWLVRFDGQDDVLRVTGTGLHSQSIMLFVVAAPHSNQGDFRGMVAANAAGQRDYQSGWTVDLGAAPSGAFEQLNVEGRGFEGVQNLKQKKTEFGQLHVLEVSMNSNDSKVSLSVDGDAAGSRPFDSTMLSLDELTLGARYFTNGPGQQQVRGHFHGDVAAVLIYDRVLEEEESKLVREFLQHRFLGMNEALRTSLPAKTSSGVPLVKVPDPPLVKMLIPGFRVQELPVNLTNVNNVRYRRDGKLVALGYNGDIHLLSDRDGDGLEETIALYWKNRGAIRGPIGMVLTPEGYPHGQGVILASKGKVSMIVDRDGDDVGDEELIVASGWQEIPQNVDAVGLAMADDGTLYFGLGTANYANAFLVDDAGLAHYELNGERGTVQRISPDWTKRETVCTGIRFPIAFDFSSDGDLFCTEQEGATWLPNGNTLDELLHIRLDGQAPAANPTGKQHFGFPPRHPRHNPLVVDEPSVFDYGPQHQSTCGFFFNRAKYTASDHAANFGPHWWHGDVIVCGQSRGKLWRTKLVKTKSGYVAQTQLIACLQMLTVDACLSPAGDLIVACHSGPPDWGTGPEGVGKLFRIHMEDAKASRPVAAWWSGIDELQIAFDQPLNPEHLRGLVDRTKIEYGVHVRAGDRWENLKPPYAVVQQQDLQPRQALKVHSVGLTPDHQILTLNTQALAQAVHHSIHLTIDGQDYEIDAMPNGVTATWVAAGANIPTWQGYLPHIDLQVCKSLLSGSSHHAALWDLLTKPGMLILETVIDCHQMLRPEVQVGAKIDHQWPMEQVTLNFTASAQLKLRTSENSEDVKMNEDSVRAEGAELAIPFAAGQELVRLQMEFPTQQGVEAVLTAGYVTAEDSTLRALPIRRFFQPFLSNQSIRNAADHELAREASVELAGGNWGQGRKLFYDQRTMCSKCHAVGGQGGKIGPDLSHLVQRDYASVLRDIVQPSRAINPDYLSHAVTTVDGQVLTGVVSSDDHHLLVADASGEVKRLHNSDVESMTATGTSIMPQDLLSKLTDPQRRDLLTYLLTPAPSMPEDAPLPAPPVRTKADVAAVLQGSQPLVEPLRPLTMVLIDGVKDHGPGEHDYPAWQRSWLQLLSGADEVEATAAREFPDEQQLKNADLLIFFQKGSFSFKREVELDQFLKRGGGAVFIHWAVNGNDRVEAFAQRIGLASWGGRISYRHGPLTLDVVNRQHPIMRNVERLELYDESYWKLSGDPSQITLLATSQEEGQATPQIWIRDHNPGRVFVSIPGHYSWTFDDPLFRTVLLRGIAWAADQPVDRFNYLVTPGARIGD